MAIVTGVLGLIATKNVDLIARTRTGVSMFDDGFELGLSLSNKMLVSMIRNGTNGKLYRFRLSRRLLTFHRVSTYNGFFDILEPTFRASFPARSILARMFMSGNSSPLSALVPALNSNNALSWLSRTVSWRQLHLRRRFPQQCRANDWLTSTSSCGLSVWMSSYLCERTIEMTCHRDLSA